MCTANLKSIICIYILSHHVENYVPEINGRLSNHLVFDVEDAGIRGRKRTRMRGH